MLRRPSANNHCEPWREHSWDNNNGQPWSITCEWEWVRECTRCSVNTGPFPSTQLRTVTPRLQWPRLSFPLPTEITTTAPVKCPPTPRCSSRPQRCHIIACFLAHAWRYFLSLDKFPKCRDHLLLFSTKQWTKHHAVAQIMYKRRIINNPIWQKRNFNKTFSEN